MEIFASFHMGGHSYRKGLLHLEAIVFYNSSYFFKYEAHGQWFADLSKTAIAYQQIPCNIPPVLL